ncbi:uncharacterized protein LOC132203158 isoform X1 [Neocloeon triangulifer]|uniref:uncharacterized protein LOC132203158 isoform X1 n=1 Tax=Neocloeon triangulifer TaxID=2078957 RepID=UPI00286EC22D|nr:uncharacterized protein LOC132203158 isoform X1 [Neocloeon triangulifer]
MHLTHAIILCSLVATSFARPRQDQVTDINRLDEPLSDPELRRTLLRVFAESLKAAADAGIQAAKKSDSGTADLKPPTADAASSEGFDRETSADELLVLSGDSTTSERTLVANPRAASTETPFLVRLDNEEPAESRESASNATTTVSPPITTIHRSVWIYTSPQHKGSAEAAATTERTVSDDPGLSSPAPSPAPPQPTVTVDNLANLTPADSADVNRFISAVSTTPDEKLGAGVEFLQAPLIAAFGLLQEESTGKTRNLVAYPVPQGVSEQLLRDERLTLSVAGQVAGRQGITFSHQPTPDASLVNFQRSLPLQQQPFQEQNFFSSSDDALRRLEKRQQLLQEQLVSLQREREALQRNFRQTRSEVLVPAESNNVFISRSLPIYLQPPFF